MSEYWSTVKLMEKSNSRTLIQTKFKFSDAGYFGLCKESSNEAFPGFKENGWSFLTCGNHANHNSRNSNYKTHGLQNLKGKEVYMTYEGKVKILKIKCEEEEWRIMI